MAGNSKPLHWPTVSLTALWATDFGGGRTEIEARAALSASLGEVDEQFIYIVDFQPSGPDDRPQTWLMFVKREETDGRVAL